MYQLTDDPNVVVNLETGAHIPNSGNWQWAQFEEWLAEGNTPEPAPPPPPGPPDLSNDVDTQFAIRSAQVQHWLDTTAQQNFYRTCDACVSFLNSDVTQFAADAQAMLAWRDAVWPTFFSMPQNWPAAPEQWPLWDAIEPLLPQAAAFGWEQHDPVGFGSGSSFKVHGALIG